MALVVCTLDGVGVLVFGFVVFSVEVAVDVGVLVLSVGLAGGVAVLVALLTFAL